MVVGLPLHRNKRGAKMIEQTRGKNLINYFHHHHLHLSYHIHNPTTLPPPLLHKIYPVYWRFWRWLSQLRVVVVLAAVSACGVIKRVWDRYGNNTRDAVGGRGDSLTSEGGRGKSEIISLSKVLKLIARFLKQLNFFVISRGNSKREEQRRSSFHYPVGLEVNGNGKKRGRLNKIGFSR